MGKEIRKIAMRAGPLPVCMGIKAQQTDFTGNKKGLLFRPKLWRK